MLAFYSADTKLLCELYVYIHIYAYLHTLIYIYTYDHVYLPIYIPKFILSYTTYTYMDGYIHIISKMCIYIHT